MYQNLKGKAVENLKKKKEAKKSVHAVGVIFTAVSILLYIISLKFFGSTAYWIKFPILILGLLYGVIYTSVLGIPFIGEDDDLTDEEIEREIVKIYKLEGIDKIVEDDEVDELELREIEALKKKWEDGEEFV